jgi:hypothetical protein
MAKKLKKADMLDGSEHPVKETLIDDLLDTGLFKSPVQEVFSPELQQLLDEF